MVEQLSPALARRIALAAQGFGRPRPAIVGTRQLNGLIDRINLLQIDSVNVFERSHYLPAFARLGAYDRTLLDRLTFDARGPHTEYWAHEAAFVRKEDWSLFRWRMLRYQERYGTGNAWFAAHESTLSWLRSELAAKGPLAASEIEHDANRRSGPWWGWSEVKRALERMFLFGEVAIAGRTRFQRRYGLVEDVLPASVLDREVSEADAIRELMRRSAVAHGVGTLRDFADYYRLKGPAVAVAMEELADAGEVVPVQVKGWTGAGDRPVKAWVHRDARKPRGIDAAALLSPFDPVVWFRDRALRMFGFHYRIEIYTPAPQRVYGYYSLPILLDDELVGRIDLKSDRQAGVLRVQSAWTEAGDGGRVAERLVPLLGETAAWQGLGGVEVAEGARGDLAPMLAAELALAAPSGF
ncbi:winged helix-turn-helix domain-containing protein [Leifsonia shinshuensis]|uniref:Winged helix-turn-helix domain-containing protein n=1 Tax=Leifsonia shinshuensis TaxID=150026 RepID=A0A7G6Y5F8_9MICO|nr:crosslink repair DNA glycosylase YcaQ family protein [Leifsonia shinshuensis]QNE33723.1 winged helix-turn-helix domain-containing protein [Leifsonia shinshuensis]